MTEHQQDKSPAAIRALRKQCLNAAVIVTAKMQECSECHIAVDVIERHENDARVPKDNQGFTFLLYF